MRQRGRSAEQNQRAAVQIHLCEASFDEVCDVVLRHAFLEGSERRAKNIEGGFASQAHQLKLMRGLVSAASDRDGIGGGVFEPGRGVAKMIEKSEPRGFVDANAPGANVLVRKGGGGDLGGTLIFLPNADFEREMEFFAEATFLEGGNHENGMANAGNDEANEAFAKAPADPREVVQRSARGEEERVIFCCLRG